MFQGEVRRPRCSCCRWRGVSRRSRWGRCVTSRLTTTSASPLSTHTRTCRRFLWSRTVCECNTPVITTHLSPQHTWHWNTPVITTHLASQHTWLHNTPVITHTFNHKHLSSHTLVITHTCCHEHLSSHTPMQSCLMQFL